MNNMPGGVYKRTDFVNFDLKNCISTMLPIQTLTVERNLVNVSEYHHLSLNEDINQTRKWKFTKHTNYIPRGLSESCFSEKDNISLEKRQYVF